MIEEIDGLVIEGWQGLLIESKNWTDPVDFTSLAKFQLAIERRPIGTLGLFFSVSGYTDAALELVAVLRPIRLLLFNREDLEMAIREKDLVLIVRNKWQRAVQWGDATLPALDPNQREILQ